MLKNLINKHTVITYLTFLIMFFLDQFTKKLVIAKMPIMVDTATRAFSDYPAYEVFSWLWIKHVVNFGAAFSIFYGNTTFLIILVSIITLILIVYERISHRSRSLVLSISLGLILSGALGNLWDRISQGYVTDFLALIYNGRHIFPVFNVADISVNIGYGLFLIHFLFLSNSKKGDMEPQPLAPSPSKGELQDQDRP